MRRMITAGLKAAALAAAPGTQAAKCHAAEGARIAKQVFDRAIRQGSASLSVGHATTAARITTADHAATADHASTAGHAATADRAATADSATKANRAATADNAITAEFADGANPILYTHVRPDGIIDLENSKGITQANIMLQRAAGRQGRPGHA